MTTPRYSKRHYEQVAALLRDSRIDVRLERPDLSNGVHGIYIDGKRIDQVAAESAPVAGEIARRTVAALTERLADTFEQDNTRFDRERFLRASEPQSQPPAQAPASCECSAPDCPVGHGYNVCGLRPAIFRLWHRLSERAVDFCEGCAELAPQSGRFSND